FGHIKFQPNGQISLPQTVIQIQDGKVVPIFAEDFLGKPRYPLPPWEQRYRAPLLLAAPRWSAFCGTKMASVESLLRRRSTGRCLHWRGGTWSGSASSTHSVPSTSFRRRHSCAPWPG